MIFKEIVDKVAWEDVRVVLLRHYYKRPDGEDEVDYCEDVLSELRLLNHIKNTDNIKLYIREHKNGKFSVFGKNCKFYKDVPEFSNNIYFSSYEEYNKECVFPLDFLSWEEWLGMGMDITTMARFYPVEIVAHSLIEMTSHGFTQEEIREDDEYQERLEASGENRPLMDGFDNLEGFDDYEI